MMGKAIGPGHSAANKMNEPEQDDSMPGSRDALTLVLMLLLLAVAVTIFLLALHGS
jgi:hypothetical protein